LDTFAHDIRTESTDVLFRLPQKYLYGTRIHYKLSLVDVERLFVGSPLRKYREDLRKARQGLGTKLAARIEVDGQPIDTLAELVEHLREQLDQDVDHFCDLFGTCGSSRRSLSGTLYDSETCHTAILPGEFDGVSYPAGVPT